MQLLLRVGSGADKDAGTLGLLFWEAILGKVSETIVSLAPRFTILLMCLWSHSCSWVLSSLC